MNGIKRLTLAACAAAMLGVASIQSASAETIFQVDLQKSGGSDQSKQEGWAVWEAPQDGNGASLITTLAGIGVTITATGASGEIQARGPGDGRSSAISGTSWDDMVEDLWCARNGDGNVTVALTGLTPGATYALIGWHNDSYLYPNNAGFADPAGYTIIPSMTTGTLVGVSDAGASSNRREGQTLTDAHFNTSGIGFQPDGTGAATILLTRENTNTTTFLVLSGLQLELKPTGPLPLPLPGVVYDFEGLNAAGANLAGQDGWVYENSGSAIVSDDVASFFSGSSGNVAYATSGGAQLSRKNDANFSFSLENKPFEIWYKVRRLNGAHHSNFFGLWADANNDNDLVNAEMGPQIYCDEVMNLKVRGANFGSITTVASNLGTDSVGLELRLVIDPTANNGDGSGRLYYRRAGIWWMWSWIAGQDVNLQILNMTESVRNPSTWNGLYIRFGTGGAMDDLTILQQPSPPSGTVISIW